MPQVVRTACRLQNRKLTSLQVCEVSVFAEPSFRLLDGRLQLEQLRAQGELVWNDTNSLVSGLFVRTIPGVHSCDGFFVAILEKT